MEVVHNQPEVAVTNFAIRLKYPQLSSGKHYEGSPAIISHHTTGYRNIIFVTRTFWKKMYTYSLYLFTKNSYAGGVPLLSTHITHVVTHIVSHKHSCYYAVLTRKPHRYRLIYASKPLKIPPRSWTSPALWQGRVECDLGSPWWHFGINFSPVADPSPKHPYIGRIIIRPSN